MNTMDNREVLIYDYFTMGLSNLEIRIFLNNHGIAISERHLKRLMNRMGLYRRKHKTPLRIVVEFILRELGSAGELLGYRWIHNRCRQNNINVSREHVRIILKELDPEGVEYRRQRRLIRRRYITRGPNFVWHMDGNDKLKPFGIAIHGCVDGFSRHIIWLNAGITNKNPRIIANHFIEAVGEISGCPRIVRADRGTENSMVCELQRFLRRNAVDPQSNRAFVYGKSTTNQRIECFWSTLRRRFSQHYIDLFNFMKEEDLFVDELDKELIRFCFLRLIQRGLDEFSTEWNCHYIRRSRLHQRPFGRPIVMNMIPAVYNTVNYIYPVDQVDVDVCRPDCNTPSEYPCDVDIFHLSLTLMEELGLDAPNDSDQATNLYLIIRNQIRRGLQI